MLVCALVLEIFLPKSAKGDSPVVTISPAVITVATTTPDRTIRYYASLYDVNYSVAKSIAWCESRYDPNAANPNSSATGLYQFLDGTWNHYALLHWGTLKGHSATDYGDSAELGVWVIAHYGTSDWLASSACWA